MELAHVIIQGVLLGGLYALFAAGLSLIFGVMRLVNIAHGDLIVVAAYMGYFTMQALGVGPFTSLFVVVPAIAVFGYALQRGLLNFALGDELPPLLVTFGLSVIIQNVLLILFTHDSRRLYAGPIEMASWKFTPDLAVGVLPVIQFVVAVAVIGGLQLVFYRTTLGRAFRATSDDPDIAQLMGIENRHIFALAMALSLAVVAVAGVFIAIRTTFNPFYCPQLLIFGFEAVELGQMPIRSVRRSDVSRLLDRVEDGSGPSMAQVTLAVVRRMFAWHAARTDDFNSPIVRGMSRIKSSEHQRTRTLTDDELVRIWRVAAADNSAFGPYIQFLLLTGCRRDEAAELPWSEIEHNLWTLPAERNKTKQLLERPLSAAALAAMARAPRFAGSDFVFSSTGGRFHGFQYKSELEKASGTSGWTLHDLRRTARSLLSRAGVSREHAERCLGHKLPGVEGVYNQYKYRPEMLFAYEKLAALIASIVDPQPNVVAMVR